MAKLSSAAWIAHELGLATSIGGTLFGREALQPALREIDDDTKRNTVSDTAWRRFSWMNLAGHAAVAATWFFGRSLLSGREVSKKARPMTIAKDALVIASLFTGIASIVAGRMLGKRVTEQKRDREGHEKLRKVVGALGMANLASNVGVAGVTTALAMEGSHSGRFGVISRLLP
jgi:uncharacterized membrane protein